MKKLLLIATLMFGTIAASAQSTDISDYVSIFEHNGVTHLADTTSLQKLSRGRRVFWTALPFNASTLVFMSMEADCVNYRLRSREMIFLTTTGLIKRDRKVGGWFPRGDEIPEKYLLFACN